MNCYSSGLLGVGMLGATFFTMTACKDQQNELTKKLSPKVNDIYINIVKIFILILILIFILILS